MERQQATDDYILASRLNSLTSESVKSTLIRFSTKHLIDKKLATKNLKTGFDFTNGEHNSSKDLRKLSRFIESLIRKKFPVWSSSHQVLELSTNGRKCAIVFNGISFTPGEKLLFIRYLRYIQYKADAHLVPVELTSRTIFRYSDPITRPNSLYIEVCDRNGCLARTYTLIWFIEDILQVLGTVFRIHVNAVTARNHARQLEQMQNNQGTSTRESIPPSTV